MINIAMLPIRKINGIVERCSEGFTDEPALRLLLGGIL
jgi:hypothetical protein